MTKFCLSYGAGVNSTALAIHLTKNNLPLDYVIFSDTGSELPETYSYLPIMEDYLRKYNIPFVTVKAKTTLLERCIRRKVIPSTLWRWCTRDFKVRPIHKFYKTLKSPIIEYIGIDYDEIHRMKDAREDFLTKSYPLIDNKIGREDCIAIIKQAHMPIPVKSGCWFCPFNNKDRWESIRKQHPSLFMKAKQIETNNKHYPKQKLIHLQSESICDGVCMT